VKSVGSIRSMKNWLTWSTGYRPKGAARDAIARAPDAIKGNMRE